MTPALDDVGPAVASLAAVAERGECLERGLLTAPVRTSCERAVSEWLAHQDQYDAARSRALRASRTIASTDIDQTRYRVAEQEFRWARTELARLRQSYLRRRGSANLARAQLADDELLRERHRSDIERARHARAELTEMLGRRLAEALQSGWPLPTWFTAVLGNAPNTADPARWRAVAVELLAYRITYGVEVPDAALGPRPGPSACARRRQWFSELDRDLFARPLTRCDR